MPACRREGLTLGDTGESELRDMLVKTWEAGMRGSGVLLRLILALIAVLGLRTVANADMSDFALFDGSNPANQPNSGAVCYATDASGANGPFTYHVAVANFSALPGEVRITYPDGDFIRFPILPMASLTFSQAAGSPSGNDKAVRVSNGGSNAQLAGSMSALTVHDHEPHCISCDGATGDGDCDAFVPN